jgi:hypothetical protein
VKICFDYMGDGTIKLRAREVTSNRECEVKLIRTGVMDVAEVAQAGSKLSILTAR